mgnify:CR=1 FL=1
MEKVGVSLKGSEVRLKRQYLSLLFSKAFLFLKFLNACSGPVVTLKPRSLFLSLGFGLSRGTATSTCLVLLLGMFLMGVNRVEAQSRIQWDSSEVMDYSYSYLNASNGLLQNEIKDALYHPVSKIIWLATQHGLVRYSGRKVEVLSPSNSEKLKDARIRDLYVYKDSAYVVYGDEHAYCEIDADGVHLKDSGFKGRRMSFLSRGNMIKRSASDTYDFYKMVISDSCAYVFSERPPTTLSMECGDDFRTHPNYFSQYFRQNSFLFGDTLFGFSRDGYLLAVHNLMLDTIGYHSDFAQNGQFETSIQLIWRKYYKHPYLIISGKLYQIIHDQNGLLLRLIAKDLPKHEYSTCLQTPHNKDIYLGTRRNGLLTLKPKLIKQVYNRDFCDYPYNNYAIAEIGADTVITADGLIFTDSKIDCSKRFNNSEYWYPLLYRKESRQLFTARERYEVGHFNLEDWTYREDSLFTSTKARYPSPMIEYNNRAYALTESLGLMRYNAETGVWDLISESCKKLAKPAQMRFQNDSIFWVVYRRGLASVNLKSGLIEEFKVKEKATRGRALSLIDEQVWFSMYGFGVFILQGDSLLKFLPKEYPEIETVHAIIPYGDKVLFSTNNGLFEFVKEEVTAYCMGQSEHIQAYAFYKEDGLLEREFNGGCEPSFLKLESGRYAFPGLTGLSFLAADFSDYRSVIRDWPIIESIEVDDRGIRLDSSNILDPDFNSLVINLLHPYFGRQENALVFYRIPQLGEVWRTLDFEKGIHFNRLPSNQDYSLEIYIPGINGEKVRANFIQFRVGPRFHETSLFYALIVLAVLSVFLVILVLIQYRNRQQKKRLKQIIESRTSELAKNNISLLEAVSDLEDSQEQLKLSLKMRDRMIAVFSHDIRGPLRFLADIAYNIKEKAKANSYQDIETEVSALESGARGAYNTANSVLEWIKSDINKERESMQSAAAVVHRVIDSKEAFLLQYHLNYEIQVEQDFEITVSSNMLDIILENIIQNALKFCQSKILVLVDGKHHNGATIKVLDDGPGITNPKVLKELNEGKPVKSNAGSRGGLGSGIGLLMARELVQKLGGKLSFVNRNSGLEVRINFPS